MRKGLLLITALLVAVATPMSLAAQEKEIEVEVKVCGETCKGELHKCKEDSKVDKATMLKLEKLQVELKLQNLELEKQKSDLQKKIHEEYMSEKPSRKVLDKLSNQLFDVQAKLLSNKHDFILEARKFATAEQIMAYHQCSGDMGCGKGHAGMKCGMGHAGMKVGTGSECGSMGHKCGSSCKSMGSCKSSGKGCAGEAMHGEKRVIMIKCDDAGCGHKDKSKCTDECLKKAVKVIEETIEKEVDKD